MWYFISEPVLSIITECGHSPHTKRTKLIGNFVWKRKDIVNDKIHKILNIPFSVVCVEYF